MISHWLLVVTIQLALFLGLCKRRHELVTLAGQASSHRRSLGEYSPALLDQFIAIVAASTLIAYAIYTISPETQAKFAQLKPEDYVISTHRPQGHALAKGATMGAVFCEILGRMGGPSNGLGGPMQWVDVEHNFFCGSIVGSGISNSTGFALAARNEGRGRIAVCFFGDGASNTGSFHEGLNLAALWKLPVLYVCENNQYGEAMPVKQFDPVPRISQRSVSYGIKGLTVDGMAEQVGAEKYAREVKGYTWDVIAGVSVGALNGAMLAMHKYDRLFEIWNTVSNDKVYTGGFGVWSALKIWLRGARSFYGNGPLQKMIAQEVELEQFKVDLRTGAVSLQSGEYVIYRPGDPHVAEAILASTVMPIIWTPVDVPPTYYSMVDGGVRNASPLGDVLDADPDEIVVVNCGSRAPAP